MSENQKRSIASESNFKDETNKKRKSSNFTRRYRFLESEERRKEFQLFLEQDSNFKPNPLDENFGNLPKDSRDNETKKKLGDPSPINEANENDGDMLNICDDKIDEILEKSAFKHAKTTVKRIKKDDSEPFSLKKHVKSVTRCMDFEERFGKMESFSGMNDLSAKSDPEKKNSI